MIIDGFFPIKWEEQNGCFGRHTTIYICVYQMEKIMLCEYGCGLEATNQLKNEKWCCSKSQNSCPSLRKKNKKGLSDAYKNGTRTPTFTDIDRKKAADTRVRLKIESGGFESLSKNYIKKELLAQQNGKCLICNISKWNKKQLTLQLDHIDGNNANNKRENVRLLCPNCHSQTETWCGAGKNTGNIKISDKEIEMAINKIGTDVNKIIKYLGLAVTVKNYKRIYRFITK